MNKSDVRVRFAPSPTGYLHIGGARTALFNWLFARHMGGSFILRIEDTDQSRIVPGAIQAIYDGMLWLGLQWDEGPDVGGPAGPYVQSERLDEYLKAAHTLLETDHAYQCFCTSERLTELREYQKMNKLPPGYDRRCRNLSPDEVADNIKVGLPHTVRMKVPLEGETRFNDTVRGPVVYENPVLDDFILLKSDGFPTYHLANVVDDHMMEISHVIRGEEWIPSTPKHVLLYQAFGWEADMPEFIHAPSLLSPGGGKLSKRKGAASVTDFEDMGFIPEAVRNFIALLGWSPGDNREKMTLNELIDLFTLERVNPKSAVFDEQKLEWLNSEYFKELPADELLLLITPLWIKAGLITESDIKENNQYLVDVVELFKSRMHRTIDFVDLAGFCFRDPEDYDEKARKKHWKPEAAELLRTLADRFDALDEYTEETTEDALRVLSEETEVGAGKLIHPTRLATSGLSFGPGLFEMLVLLGQKRVVRRMRKAVEIIEKGSV
jgi:glutamyl-tRNA synthetase